MYIYNITSVINPDTHQEWLEWIRNKYIPKMASSKYIESVRVFKVLGNPNEPTYAIHHQTELPQQLLDFIRKEVPLLQEECRHAFGEKVLMFGTELKEVL
ncbi:MAG: DUF4286 family protein [Capnocytophaga sp.]|nr:DUF4286 family protein [Capnocytophaga sp.]